MVLINIAKAENGTNNTERINTKYRHAYDGLVVGYDCATPKQINSHELDSIESCEDRIVNDSTIPATLQILQRSSKYKITAISCSLRRTRKLSNCGTSDHSVSCYSEEYTYRKIEVSEKQCKKLFEAKMLTTPDRQIINLKINAENTYAYYEQGNQYAHHDLLGSSIKCRGDNYIFYNKTTVSHIVIYHEDTLILEEATLIAEGNQIEHKEKGRILDCAPTNEKCNFQNTIYVWKYNKPNCNLFQTKVVEGQIMSLRDKKIFVANDSLVHLEIQEEQLRCERKVASTDFKDIFILDLAKEKRIEEDIKVEDFSIFRDYSVRDKWVFNKLTQLLRISIQEVSHQHCLDNKIARLHYSRLHARIKASNIHPFSIRSNTGSFVLPFGENIYSFTCQKRLFRPVGMDNKKCYASLSVLETTKQLTTTETNTTAIKFLSPYDRILQPSAPEVPCCEFFTAKFKTVNNNWIASTLTGIQRTAPPNSKLKWLDMGYGTPDTLDKVMFDIDK